MGCGSSCCRFVGQLTVSLKFHLCIKLAAIFHFPFLLTFLLPVLFLLLLVKFLFNFRLACVLFTWRMRVIFAYICGGFLLKLRIRRVLFSTLLTQLRLPTESICPAYLHNKHSPQLARAGQSRAEQSRLAGSLFVTQPVT